MRTKRTIELALFLLLLSFFIVVTSACTKHIKQREWDDPQVWCRWGKTVFPQGKHRTVTIRGITYECGE